MKILKVKKSKSGYTVTLSKVNNYFVIESTAPGALPECADNIGEAYTWIFKAYLKD